MDNDQRYENETDEDFADRPDEVVHRSYSYYFRVVTYDIPNE